MREQAIALLREWLAARLDADTWTWLAERAAALASAPEARDLQLAFALVPRRLPRRALELSADDLAAAGHCLPGWSPRAWSLVDAGRILLLAELPAQADLVARQLRMLCETAEVGEAISLYRGLPLYPCAQALEPQVAEGLRGNVRDVFEAIAHDNPYPRACFDEHRWNHMVLKALFIGSALAPIQGLDARANDELARIMLDFAHERRAAGRPVPPDIWRCVGPFARGAALEDLRRALHADVPAESRAAALALAASPDPTARDVLAGHPQRAADIAAGRLDWGMLQ